MLLAVIIVAPILFIAAIAIGALSFSGPRFEPQPTLDQIREPAEAPQSLVFAERGPRMQGQVPVEQVLRSVEEHLRRERERAAKFARDPSVSGLSAN